MFHSIMKIIVRKVIYRMFLGHSKAVILLIFLVLWSILMWFTTWRLVTMTSKALTLSIELDHSLDQFRRNRSLAHYLDSIQVLIEPSSTPCAILDVVPVIFMVASAPDNIEQRLAVRETWAKYQPTYFVLGLRGNNLEDNEQLVDIYIEAKQYSDMIVFDFQDHYQNLTLKTALMMQWIVAHCPHAQFFFKADDDVLVNPWTLKAVLKEHADNKLIGELFEVSYKVTAPQDGYRRNNTLVYRNMYGKCYVPRWMYTEDTIPQYLAGAGYIVSVEYLRRIIKTAYRVPLLHLEDVYFTYIIANKNLGLTLSHDRRLNPYKPWLKVACAYWSLAYTHGFSPEEMIWAWSSIESIAKNKSSCSFFNSYLNSDLFLY